MHRVVARLAAVVVLGAVMVLNTYAYDRSPIKIVSRPVTPRDIKDQRPLPSQPVVITNLPSTTQKSAGLNVTGVGQPVYLEVEVTNRSFFAPASWAAFTNSRPTDTKSITGIVWSVTSAVSSVSLIDSPLTNLTTWPIYDPGNRNLYFIPTNKAGTALQGRVKLVPDKPGSYYVTCEVSGYSVTWSTNSGSAVATTNPVTLSTTTAITVGTYVGVDSACEYCHDGHGVAINDNVAGWRETMHSDALTRKIDGNGSSISKLSCIECHSVGYDVAVTATNGGFDDVMAQTGWTFPATITNGNWAAMPAALQAKGNIQCENCHGPADQHWKEADTSKIDVNISVGVCAWCHDSGTTHIRPFEWAQSKHGNGTRGYPWSDSTAGEYCVKCHSGIAFIDMVDGDGVTTRGDELEGITCAVCHDPHSGANEHQIRTTADVTIGSDTDPVATISAGGLGKLCMNCHRTRYTSADEFVNSWVYPTSFGPHASPVADIIAGVNGIEYGGLAIDPPLNPHLSVEDSCVHCHMVDLKNDSNASYSNSWMYAGGHTMKMVTTNGVDITKGCLPCHVTDTFDINGVQTEVTNLLVTLASLVPNSASSSAPGGIQPSVTTSSTKAQLKAAWNWRLVNSDKSKGVHNPGYAIALLKASIADIMATLVPQTSRVVVQIPSTGQAAWWLVGTNGAITSTQTVYAGSTSWLIRGVGDVNKDGVPDLIWQLPTGQVACWYMNTNGTAKSSALIYFGATTWQIRGAGDIDKDGVADLVWQLPTGQVAVWFMNANGTMKSSKVIYSGATTWQIRAVGDISNDGVADLVWQLPTGQVAAWYLNADATLKSGVTIYSGATTWLIRAAADINKDGVADLIWQLPTGQTAVWFLNSSAVRVSGANIQATATSWQVSGAGN